MTGSSATGLSSYGLFENLSQRSRSNSWESTKSDKGDSTTRSDIDIVVCFSDEMQHMLHGEALLIQALADHFTKIKDYVIESTDGVKIHVEINRVLPNARVPLIKAEVVLTRSISVIKVPVDISIDGPNTGIASTTMIRTEG